jgi:hypothetical protein
VLPKATIVCSALQVPWWYNWGLDPDKVPGVDGQFSQEFVAMVWGGHVVPELDHWSPHLSTKVLLGFNEPNLYTQANLTAAAACELWQPVLAAAKKHGLQVWLAPLCAELCGLITVVLVVFVVVLIVAWWVQVGSPAANHCKPTTRPQPGVQGHACWATPEDWFDTFFAQPGCGVDTVDFITTHKYGCNASDTVAFVKMLHDRYHKPVWLTEFSCGGAPEATQLEFMQHILPIFDTMVDIIPRYAWFAARTSQQTAAQRHAALISNESNTLTAIGRWYNSTV